MPSDSQASPPYLPIQPGGSLMVAWQLRDRHVLIVGGGEVAASRLVHVLSADGLATVVAPRAGLHPETRYRIDAGSPPGRVRWIDRHYRPDDLDLLFPPPATSSTTTASATGQPVAMVLATTDAGSALSAEIAAACRRRRIPVNVADVPACCDFFFGSVHRDGPVQVMVSTNGRGPRLAAIIRRMIAGAFGGSPTRKNEKSEIEDDRKDPTSDLAGDYKRPRPAIVPVLPSRPGVLGAAVENVALVRDRIRSDTAAARQGKKHAADSGSGEGAAQPHSQNLADEITERMNWMSSLCDTWTFDQLAALTGAQVDLLARAFAERPAGPVPAPDEVGVFVSS